MLTTFCLCLFIGNLNSFPAIVFQSAGLPAANGFQSASTRKPVVLVAINYMLRVTVLVWFASGCSWLTLFLFRNHSGSASKYQERYHVRVCQHISHVQHQSSCLIEAFIRAQSLALGSPELIGLNQGYNQLLLGSPAPIGNPRGSR